MEKHSLFTGKDIVNSNADILQPVSLQEVFKQITEPDTSLLKLTAQLAKVMSVDENAYHKLKTRLPYFIGASFKHDLRKTENFLEINWVIVDIDKCFNTLEKEIEMKDLFKKDSRVALMFTSPSNRGLKLVFRLSQPITDSSFYTNFYKAFAAELARHYKLEKYIDFKTSDVTRVSFLNADAEAWINENATPVDWRDYISKYDIIKQNDQVNDEQENDENNGKGPNDAVYTEILKKLNPKTPKRQKIIFVPEVLNSIIQPITNLTEKSGLKIKEVRDIHYGKKFVFENENDFAEINVFYGKNGFTVSITPKRGHNPHLSEVAKAIIEKVIFDDPARMSYKPEGTVSPAADAINDIQLN